MIAALRRFATRYLIADAAPFSAGERWRSSLAALLGMLLIEAFLGALPANRLHLHLLAPLGASSVILFALPHSPLGQPWSTGGGLLLSALVGWACGRWIAPAWLAVALALAISVWLMARLRCIHPPGGAMAVVFAALPQAPTELGNMLFNVAAVLAAAFATNSLFAGRCWPQCISQPTEGKDGPAREPHRIAHADLQYALTEIDAYLDISEADLVTVYDLAIEHALRRSAGLSCGEIVRKTVSTVEFGTGLDRAWRLMRGQRLGALPVVDRSRRVIGLLTADDFLRHVEPDAGGRLGAGLRRLLRPNRTPGEHPEVAGEIMSTNIVVAGHRDPVSQLAARLAEQGGQAAVPVVDDAGRLIGLLGQHELLAALRHRRDAELARQATLDAPPLAA